ncbi:MAG: hypothetical protein ACR2GY_04245 [Phycisphaerales bacterium]
MRRGTQSTYRDYRALPLRPIFPGFIINTLFYAAIWFTLFFGFTSAKRFIRKKRGRCPQCNYDLPATLQPAAPNAAGNGDKVMMDDA